MITDVAIVAFRRELVERLATTDFARQVALHGKRPGLAESIGVTEGVLDDAARLSRAGFAPAPGALAPITDIATFVPLEIARPLVALSTQMAITHSQLARSLLHAAMQTPGEPTPRAGKNWGPLPGCQDARARLDALYTSLGHNEAPRLRKRFHITIALSDGLRLALDARATAFGVRRSRYVLLWLADLVDGLLGDLTVVGVGIGQLFDDPRAYVLPLVASPAPAVADSAP